MKQSLRTLFVAALFTVSTLAIAEPGVELIWRFTTGSGTPGSSEIRAEEGDYVILDIYVREHNVGLHTVSLSLYWDPYDLEGFNAKECPESETNVVEGYCTDPSSFYNPIYSFAPVRPGVALDWDVGSAEGFDVMPTNLVDPGFFGVDMHLGSIEFYVESTATTEDIVVGYTGFDGVLDGSGDIFYPEATATILPPPSGC
jgi:hypothetical protein